MWFIGMLLGLVLGGLAWGFDGAVVLGFLGFIGGLIFSNRGKQNAPAATDRLSVLEQRVAQLEERLARFERGKQPVVEPVANIRSEEEQDVAVDRQNVPQEPVPASIAASARVPAETKQAVLDEGVAKQQAEDVAAPEPVQSVPSEPARPNFIVRWFTEGNVIVRVGVTILFFGIAFLVKYAADRDMVPIELRLAGAAAGGIAMLIFGWRLRDVRAGYALTLQGAGVAVLYLTIFGAFRLWGLLPAGIAFPMLVAVAAFSAFLAVKQDSMALAVAGSAGGFLAPILASTGQGSHVMLFSYYLVLNLGILAIAWHKAWRPLNLLGFLFTFFIGLAWGDRFYRPEFFASTEPFLILHFLLYVTVAVLFAHRQAPRIAHYVDGTLIFGVPLLAFGLQYALVKDIEYGLAFSSLALGGFYLLLARVLHARQRDTLRLLVECFLALGVVFLTLAIPLALDARWTSAAWALEGAGIVWIGVRQKRWLARLFGMALQLLAGAAFLHGLGREVGHYPLINSVCLGALLLVLGGLLTYRQLSREASVSKIEYSLAAFWFAWALLWWLFGGIREIDRFILRDVQITVAVLFMAGTALGSSLLWRYRDWHAGEWPVLGLLPVLFVLTFFGLVEHDHPFAHVGWLVWPLALAIHYANLRRHEPEETPRNVLGVIHVGTLLLIAMLGAWELHWLARDAGLGRSAWSVASVLVVPGLLLLGLCHRSMAGRWPVDRYETTMLRGAGIPLLFGFWLWTFYANFRYAGGSAPLPYLPLLNAIDLGHLFILLVGVTWWRRQDGDDAGLNFLVRLAAGVAAFVWVNAILLRTIHHWAGVPYRLNDLWDSMLVQASVSIFWTVLALTLMVLATRKGLRGVWMLGAGLMAAVVAKLFLVDLSNIDGIERIVSFIGVGILMAVIGWFSPLPPKRAEEVA
ncbi:MAG: DUF2339 domain-containing protein [Burkholderiales bacterium]|nr:DUF2339 domain-containing protein [Burkholderiales bacterium]